VWKDWRIGKQICRTKKWNEFQVLLDAQLRLVRQVPDRYIILSSRNAHRFVQFASADGGDVFGEAVGNHFLNAAEQLSPTTCRSLCGMGWMLPHTSGWGGGNFWRRWTGAVSSGEIATVAVRKGPSPARIGSSGRSALARSRSRRPATPTTTS
jgi:hypothetical protein